MAVMMGLGLAGCSSGPETSKQAREKIDQKFAPQVGEATKAEFVEEFGTAEWCRPKENGSETCHFSKKTGTKWVGTPKDRKSVVQYDDVTAEFDQQGRLRNLESKAQR